MDGTAHCHHPNCSWIRLDRLTGIQAPPLLPNPELSGIGVILGFSITAYITVFLLVFHYTTVHNPRRVKPNGTEYTNPVDGYIITFVRQRVISWKPSRRFEYAMEKSVLIISDTQLVSGLAILIAGFSQLNCGITAYHWQILVYIAWFSSFTFLSAVSFLEGYFQANKNLRIIRMFFMCLLGGLQIGALLPTGSKNWLDVYGQGGNFYPSLGAECYYKQLADTSSFTKGGPRIWSMVFSVLVVGVSYIHSGTRLFDPTADFSRKYLRHGPGTYFKSLLHFFEHKATKRGFRAAPWVLPYLTIFAIFTNIRAFYDIAESMLAEIIWLTFAVGWGTIKVWGTRVLVTLNAGSVPTDADFANFTFNKDLVEEDSWSFGQTLPLVLLLLPILSMAQAYLDNDAKAQEVAHQAAIREIDESSKRDRSSQLTAELSAVRISNAAPETTNPSSTESCGIARCNHHQPSVLLSRACSTTQNDNDGSSVHSCHFSQSLPTSIETPPPVPLRSRLRSTPTSRPQSLSILSTSDSFFPQLPRHPYPPFISYPWYIDHVSFLVFQIIMLGVFILSIQDLTMSVLGVSALLRSRIFLLWIFAIIPISSLLHLAFWYFGALILAHISPSHDGRVIHDWLNGTGRFAYKGKRKKWILRITTGEWVFWWSKFLLKTGLLVFTFLVSQELAGPEPLFEE